ncbi:MAG: phosphatidylserine decarboxylase [Lentisphaerae bacterium]|nr:phosphatidylserine decarboxylase [Lentisphaerota bacterium]
MLKFRPEVLPFLAASLVAAVVVLGVTRACGTSWCTASLAGGSFLVIFSIYFLYFFRDPERIPPGDPDAIVSAGEGRLASINHLTAAEFARHCQASGLKLEDLGDFISRDVTRISVFLSPLNVHVNRSPITGRSRFLGYFPGKHIFTFDEKSSEENQHNSILIENARTRCLLNQIVGPVCRRVVYWPSHDQAVDVQQGDRIGMMKFGSRLDLYFPRADIDVVIAVGAPVRAGETIIARLRRQGSP